MSFWKMVPKLGRALLICLPAACTGSVTPRAVTPHRAPPGQYVDVEAENLDPDAELEALLRGEEELGIAGNVHRIAAPPWVMLGDGTDKWRGEASAELVAAQLSAQEGTSVVQRGELLDLLVALKKAQGQADERVLGKGKLVGAELIVTGTLMPDGDSYLGVLKAVRVADGTLLPAVRFRATGEQLAVSVNNATARMIKTIGLELNPSAPPTLPREAAELAARARELQFSGRLLEAQALYARALEKPSNAFRYEADYLMLMNDLGMDDWVEDRAKRVLASMPRTGANVCSRAQLLIELARRGDDEIMKPARDAVRAAASCGDAAVVTRALTTYGWRAGRTHFPSAKAAYERASRLADKGSEYMRCHAAFQKYYWAAEGVDVGGNAEQRWLDVARVCKKAGNMRLASIATRNAAAHAWSPKQRILLRQEALTLARVVGGTELDGAREALAQALREQGRPSEADDLLMESIGTRLRAIQALYGGAVDPEARLDQDFLTRAKAVPNNPATRSPNQRDQLLAKAHRKALASLLEQWAARTEPESESQAAVYHGIGKALDPPKPDQDLEGLEGIARHEKRLAIAKLPLEKIERLEGAPLRGESADMDQALYALWDWFFLLREQGKGTLPMRKRLVAAAKKVTSWHAEPRRAIDALRMEAFLAADQESQKQGVAILLSARQQVVDAPSVTGAILADMIGLYAKIDPKQSLTAARERLESAKRVSPEEWVNAVHGQGVRAIGQDPEMVASSSEELLRLAKQFESDQFFEASARALERAAWLDTDARHAVGTVTAVERYAARAKVLERLGDPLRTLQARADVLGAQKGYFNQVYRSGSQAALERDPTITAASGVFAREVEQLVAAGRMRDAVRLVTRVPETTHISPLLGRALDWAESFKDSKEQPFLVGKLYAMQAVLAKTRAEKQALLARSREAYVRGGNVDQAIWQARRLVSSAAGEDEVHDYMTQCLAIAEQKPSVRLDCFEGLAQYLFRGSSKVIDPTRYQRYVTSALASVSDLDRYTPRLRYTLRTNLAVIAAVAGELEIVKRLDREVREYYTKTAPSSYELAIHFNQLGKALETRNPDLAADLYLAFDEARGASAYWRAEAYYYFANTARRSGNEAGEARLFEEGRRSAAQFPFYYYHYEIYPVRAAIEKKAWRDAEKTYTAAATKLEKLGPSHELALFRVELGLALARALRKDHAGAIRALERFIESGAATTEPCFTSHALEIASAIEAARGACTRAAELKQQAGELRTRCAAATCTKPANQTDWCDSVDDYTFRAQNACKEPFSGTTELFPL